MTTPGGSWNPGPAPAPGWGYTYQAPQPGVIPLRPLGFGDIINGVLATFRRYPKPIYLPMLGIALVATVLLGVGTGIGFATLGGLPDDFQLWTGGQAVGLIAVIAGTTVITVLCLVAAGVVAATTSTVVLRHAVLGRPLTVRQAWAESRGHLWRVLGTTLLVGLPGLGIVLVSALPGIVLALTVDSAPVVVLGFLLLIPGWAAALYVQVRLVLAIPVLVMEEQRPMAALRRAWKLNHGAWWRSFGIPYVINLIGSFAVQLIVTPFTMIGFLPLYTSALTAQADPYAPPPSPNPSDLVLMLALMFVGVAIASTLIMPLTPLTNGLLYIDRRIRLESLDTTLAAAAGIPLADPTPRDTPPSQE